MQKSASKNIIPSGSYGFLNIRVAIQLLYVRELQIAIAQNHLGTIYLDTIHARDLKFCMYLPCM